MSSENERDASTRKGKILIPIDWFSLATQAQAIAQAQALSFMSSENERDASTCAYACVGAVFTVK